MFGHSVKDLFGEVIDTDSGANGGKGGKRKGPDGRSLDPDVIQRTPHWMSENPKWLERKVLEDEGYVQKEVKPTERLVEVELTDEEIKRAEEMWEQFGGTAHCNHERYDTSDSEAQQPDTKRRKKGAKKRAAVQHITATDDPDTGAAAPLLDSLQPGPAAPQEEAVPANPRLYNFCLNRKCPSYGVFDLNVQQRWGGECCHGKQPLPNQPGMAEGAGGMGEEGEDDDDDGDDEEADWDITDADIAELMQEDPETADILQSIKGVYSTMQPATATPAEVAAAAAALLVAAAAGVEAEAEADESEDDEEEEEEEEDDPAEFVGNCHMLMHGMREALTTFDGVVHDVEPFTSLFARMSSLLADFQASTGIGAQEEAKKLQPCVTGQSEEGNAAPEACSAVAPEEPQDAGAAAAAAGCGSEVSGDAPAVAPPQPQGVAVQEGARAPVDPAVYQPFKIASLETIRVIRREFNIHKNKSRPPKTPVVIDGKSYDL